MISPGFFLVFQNFIFWIMWVKEQKLVQNEKKICLLRSIPEKPYAIWLSFMLNNCKMTIFWSSFFFLFKILIFWVHNPRKEQRTVHNNQNYVYHAPFLRKHTSYNYDFWYTFVKGLYMQQFFSFFKILICEIFRWKKGKNGLNLPIWVCFALYLRNCRLYHQNFDNNFFW